MKKELAKTFSPVDIEDKWYRYWESNGYYKMGEDESKLDSFSILLPPPKCYWNTSYGAWLQSNAYGYAH